MIQDAAAPDRLLEWIVNHDDSRLFVISYIGLAVVLSMTISLFWLVAVVAVHAGLEWYCHWRRHPSVLHTAARVVWEIKLDIGLILFALVLGVYLSFVFGVAGLSLAARGVQGAGRVVAWQRVLRGVLITLDDAALAARAAVGSPGSPVVSAPEARWGGWAGRWALGDKASLAFGAGCLFLLLSAPWLAGHTLLELGAILGSELHPWP
jgi:hypothetical protein